MKTIVQKISFIVISVLMMIFSVYIYADTKTTEVCLECSPTIQSAPWVRYQANSKTQYTLTTRGIKASNQEELVTDWVMYVLMNEDSPSDSSSVVAACGRPLKSGENWVNMAPGESSMLEVPPIVCRKGEDLFVSVLGPKCSNREYSYIGTLTIKTDDEDSNPSSIDETISFSIGNKNMNISPPKGVPSVSGKFAPTAGNGNGKGCCSIL